MAESVRRGLKTVNEWMNTSRMGTLLLAVALTSAGAFFGAVVSDEPVTAAPSPAPVLADAFSPATGETDAILSIQQPDGKGGVYHRCTATLITAQAIPPKSSKWAITAAHCVTRPPKAVEEAQAAEGQCGGSPLDKPASRKAFRVTDFGVRGGTTGLGTGGQTARIAEAYYPKGWAWGLRDDIALIRLAQPLNIRPMVLSSQAPAPDEWGLVRGWGRRPDGCGAVRPTMEQWGLQATRCMLDNAKLAICAKTRDGAAGPCSGSSGAPLAPLVKGEASAVVGVYSTETTNYCGDGTSRFTAVAGYMTFISSTMGRAK